MSRKFLAALAATLGLMGGCAQNSTSDAVPERGDPGYLIAKNPLGQELYVADNPGEKAADFRRVYIAPARLDQLQIIQPEGVQADGEWAVSDVEAAYLQAAVQREFSNTLSFESAYNVVDSADKAQMIVHTTVVAIHPYATRAEVEAGARSGGAITVSLALVNAETGKVMIRSVDTVSSDDIWAFHEVDNEDDAITLIFRAWGNSMRRGLLFLQGRAAPPPGQEALVLKPQR